MRNFYYFPVVDKKATGQHIKSLVEKYDISLKQLKTQLYDYDNYNNPETKELSDQTIYAWYSGKNLPELRKLLRLSRLLHTTIEDIIIYRCEFVQIEDKKSKSTKSGTKIHSLSKELFFEEENLTIEELQKKYDSDFKDLIFENKRYTFTIYEDDFHESLTLNDDLFLLPDYNLENLKENVIKAIKQLSYSNKIFETLFNTYRQKINGWKSKYTNPKNSSSDSQKKLAAIPETENLLSLLRMANMKVIDACFIQYIAQKNKKFNLDQFEDHYERILNRNLFEKQYKKSIEDRDKYEYAYYEFCKAEYYSDVKEYDKRSLEDIVYSLDTLLPDDILEKKLNHDVLIYLYKKYETKIENYSYEPGTFTLNSYILERAKKEKVFNDEDFKKFSNYIYYMIHFKSSDDYKDY